MVKTKQKEKEEVKEAKDVSQEAKTKALDLALEHIEKQFGKGSIMKLGQDFKLDIPAISTGSVAVDIALGVGGVPRGRVIEIFGPESSGKTTMTLRSTPHKATDEQHETFKQGFESMKQGFKATFGQLAQYLARVQ